MLNRSCLFLLLAALWWEGIRPGPATAQSMPGTHALKSEVYFGMGAADAKIVDEQGWEKFVAEVLVPQFPDGLTILEGSGRSGGSPGSLNSTRILIVVHSDDEDAQSRLREIKTEYKKRFAGVGIFHTDQPVRVRASD